MPEITILAAVPDSLDTTKERVMSANNADGIFEHIKQLGNDPKHRQRWIWELMQNAQDVAFDGEVNVAIDYNGAEVKFTHNGQAFSEEDITHLIYHGSSKPGLAGKTGKFGTGFMTTHLLSKKVQVKGSLLDGRSFDFLLDREAVDGKDMLRVLDVSWNGFKASIKNDDPQPLTSFTYMGLTTADTSTTVEPVLGAMAELMPAVMAFSGIIKNVKINNKGQMQTFHVAANSTPEELLVKCSTREHCSVLLIRDIPAFKTKIAIPADGTGKIMPVAPDTPRLYITFPLVGTDQAFPLPFLIHSQNFEPNKEREKIWIELDTPETKINKDILQAAFTAYYDACAALTVQSPREGIHLLAGLGKLPATEWLDKTWYKQQLTALFEKIDLLPLVTSNVETKKIALAKAIIPYTAENQLTTLWDTWNDLHQSQVPILEQSLYWKKLIDDRAGFHEGQLHQSARTLKDCCKEIDALEGHILKNIVLTTIEPLDFIITLVKTIEAFKEQPLWVEFSVLPNQAGQLQKFNALQSAEAGPEAISEALKDIAKGLDYNIRTKLLHPSVIIVAEDHQLAVYKRATLVNYLLEKVKAADLTTVSAEFQLNSRLLLEWLVSEDRQTALPGYPNLMHSGKWDKISPGTDRLLLPVTLWPSEFAAFSELFPADFILAQENAFIFTNQSLLGRAQSWLLKSPLYDEQDSIKPDNIRYLVTTREDKEKLSSQPNAEWSMPGTIRLSQVAYFNRPADKNIIDRARGSAKRTKQLLELITRALLKTDQAGLQRTMITLTSGETTIQVGVYPSSWLRDIKARDWVRNSTTANSADKPSAESFLPYFDRIPENMDLYNSLQRPEVARWLHFLDIGVGDLLRNIRSGDNEEEKMSWDQSYVSILMNEQLTPEKVTAILGDQELLAAYESKKRDDNLRRKNKEIGTEVEKAFEKAIEGLPGYKIRREPIGSDYVIESDDNHYLLIDRPDQKTLTIEFKSSRAAQVKMTATQGDTAQKLKENYILCVVPLDGAAVDAAYIVQQACFATDIARLLDGKVTNVHEINALKNAAATNSGQGIWTDIEGMNVRYVVNQGLWSKQRPEVLDFTTFMTNKVK